MDDIYEYENSEYRLVSMQMKAIAYDVVTGISKKKNFLKKSGVNENESISDELTAISDRIIELADSLEEEFQRLDQIEEKREVIAAEEKKSIKKRTPDVVESKPEKEEPKTTKEEIKDDTSKESEQTNNLEEEKSSDKIVIEESQKPIPKVEEKIEKIKIDIPKPEDTEIEEPSQEEAVKAEPKEHKPPLENNVEKGHFVIPLSAFKNADNNQEKKKEEKNEGEKEEDDKKTPIENNVEKGHFVIPLSAFKNSTLDKTKEAADDKEPELAPVELPTIEDKSELSLPDINIKTESAKTPIESQKETNEPTIASIEPEVNESAEIEEKTSAKKRFQKQTKNLSKAIMVRPNQLENLRKSRRYQEQLLIKQGVFEEKEIREEEKNPINERPKELPDDIERQIEDLTVKANIYYNEGEVDKAQELYDKIRELNEQYR